MTVYNNKYTAHTAVQNLAICDPLSETRHIVHFMIIEITPEIGIPMCNCAAGKNGSDWLLGSELRSKMGSRCEMQLFENTRFYVATVNFNVSVYYHVT